ncbi:Very-long-chain 3-oxoacyl-CoA synthase [Handroanthus impetiginosus]|uniref:3-ketoacyl-CoA synthase n=1 Tax=Handroanthus impetiginosus TaxID=429701 RepID=A0A2G9HFA9_9LAMI|nr:Very-long-chain 3-oxoacyl-CoA synthase [Handroanthus impetiginosus]
MATKKEYLSPEIVNRGIKEAGPDAGSPSFSIKVRRGLPDFLSSVNLKYVKLGYGYLMNHSFYFVGLPMILVVFGALLGKLITWDVFSLRYYSQGNILVFLGFLCLFVYVYLDLTPCSTYLVDFACYLPPDELKITKEEYINLAKKSGQFNDAAIQFQHRVLKNSGLGDETYLPRFIFNPSYKRDLKVGREEAAASMFSAVDDVFAATGVRPKDIRILIVNCGILNTTPSLSAMIINRYKLSHRIQSFNLGGMGCAAGITAVDLANDLLNAYPGSYALIVSTEVISFTWYGGNDLDMLLPNCFLRMGAAAVLLSNRRLDQWRSKYQLKQLVRTHKGVDNRSFKSIQLKEDSQGIQGLSVSKDVIEVGGHALKANITTLGPLVLPVSEQFNFFKSLIFKKSSSSKPYIPDYKLAFEHVCILATSKKVLDEIQKNLDLSDEYMEASRKKLERFGNTSSSSIWYELAYLEAKNRIKKGDRVWQLALGSGLKCNSVVWKAVRTVRQPKRNPWNDN